MQNIDKKSKYIGEIITILMIQLLMMLFRLVEPIHWPSIFPGQYKGILNEVAYFGIEFILVIVIIAHFIFQISFKELGMVRFKDSLASLIGNLCFLGLSVGVAYFMSQFSKNVEVDVIYLLAQIVTNFITIAFLKELIFRGFLFQALYKLTNGKGMIASVITAVFSALTYVPSLLVTLNEVSIGTMLQALIIPFGMGIYLGLLYYYSQNLWMCTIIHGVLISLLGLEQDFAIGILESIYSIGLIIYLIRIMVRYYKYDAQQVEVAKSIEMDGQEEIENDEDVPVEQSGAEDMSISEDKDSLKVQIQCEEQDKSNEKSTLKLGQQNEIRSEIVQQSSCEIKQQEEVSELVENENETIVKKAEPLPDKMLSELDQLHKELKEKAKEKLVDKEESIPTLFSVLSNPLEQEITEEEDRL